MLKNFEELQNVSADATKAFGMLASSVQQITTEFVTYSKKSFEDGTKALEQLLGVKSPEKAIEVQQDYIKNAYEGFVAQATKIGEFYSGLVKETYKPLEGFVAKKTEAK
jgi:hypothetical protein